MEDMIEIGQIDPVVVADARRGRTKYPWAELAVGQKFVIPLPQDKREEPKIRARLEASRRWAAQRMPDRHFVIRVNRGLGIHGWHCMRLDAPI